MSSHTQTHTGHIQSYTTTHKHTQVIYSHSPPHTSTYRPYIQSYTATYRHIQGRLHTGYLQTYIPTYTRIQVIYRRIHTTIHTDTYSLKPNCDYAVEENNSSVAALQEAANLRLNFANLAVNSSLSNLSNAFTANKQCTHHSAAAEATTAALVAQGHTLHSWSC